MSLENTDKGKEKMSLNLERKVDLPVVSIASFDIGLRNLSVCVLDRIESSPFFRISKWKLISLVSQSSNKSKRLQCSHVIQKKVGGGRSKKVDGSVSSTSSSLGYRCGKGVSVWSPEKNEGFCRAHGSKKLGGEYIKYTTSKNISDLELNMQIIRELEKMPELWVNCKHVILESQMKSSMKKIGYMIFGYLVSRKMEGDRNPDLHYNLEQIRVINACHKLDIPAELLPIDLPEGDKSSYNGRKLLAKVHCPKLLEHCDPYFLQFYESHLQGLWYLLTKF